MFKRYIVTLMAFLPIHLLANNFSVQLDSANSYYQSAQYEQAIEIYESIIADDYESAEIYYNLGNAYYKSNKFPMAIVNYERALKLNPSDEDITFNLQLANTHVVDKIDVLPEFFLKSWSDSLVKAMSSNQWAIVSIVLFVVGLALILMFFLSSSVQLRKIVFWCGALCIVVSLFAFKFSGQQKQTIINEPEVIVITPSVVVRSAPNNDATELFLIHEGLKVKVTNNRDGWSEIKLSDGNKGWVKTTDFVKI